MSTDSVNTQMMERKGYIQSFKRKDMHTRLGAVAVALGLVLQVLPGKWPKNYWISAV